jgi:predicted RNA-binding protein with PUA-like domain
MSDISIEQIEQTFEYGKKLYDNEITLAKASSEAAANTQMSVASAKMYVEAVPYMLKGKVYRRKISHKATEYYLEKIQEEYGNDALLLAITSLEQFVDYSKNILGENRPGLIELARKFRGDKAPSYWIVQGNPKRWDINHYLKNNDLVYWGVQRENHREQMEIGDRVFFWRSKGNTDAPYGIVGTGRIIEKPTPLDKIKYPEHLIEADRDINDDITMIGIRIEDLRLTPEEGMVQVEKIKKCSNISNMQLLTARQGSSFNLSVEQFNIILDLWNKNQSNSASREENAMYTSQALKIYIKQTTSQYEVIVDEGPYIVFGSDRRSISRFLINYHHLIDGLTELKASNPDYSHLQEYVEQEWRDLAPLIPNSHVFRSLLRTQTGPTAHLISHILCWLNDVSPSEYNDRDIPIDDNNLQKAIDVLKLLQKEKEKDATQDGTNNLLQSSTHKSGGENLIVYGAPGSGKSYYINQLTSEKKVIRTVFHPEYQNSDFVGGLRPYSSEDGITYSFVPGPFIDALLLAIENNNEQVYLIIEEINRANAAAVFGDIFQLLDRKNDNNSEYTITPETTLKKYLEDKNYPTPKHLNIPANLSILATMNSSDQGVFLLDSAFKRRWEFKYCPVDFEDHKDKPTFKEKVVPYNGSNYSWADFAETINTILKQKKIEEDRLIGPYFLTDKERRNPTACKDAIAGKLLIYLWDDVLRHDLREHLFSSKINTFSDLVNLYNSGQSIFSSEINKLLEQKVEEEIIEPDTEIVEQENG